LFFFVCLLSANKSLLQSKNFPDNKITTVDPNSAATSAMLKVRADKAATGENAVIAECRTVEIIIDSVRISIDNSLLVEITSQMALLPYKSI